MIKEGKLLRNYVKFEIILNSLWISTCISWACSHNNPCRKFFKSVKKQIKESTEHIIKTEESEVRERKRKELRVCLLANSGNYKTTDDDDTSRGNTLFQNTSVNSSRDNSIETLI